MADGAIQDISGILDQLDTLADEQPEVSIGNMVDVFGHRGYGSVLAVPALVGASPIGGIPFVPTILAVVVLIVAIQMVFGKSAFWLPNILSERHIGAERLSSGIERIRPWAKRIDRLFTDRLEVLTSNAFERVAALCCVLLAFFVPPLELVPFAAIIPFLAILLFGVAMVVGDGVVMLVAFLAAGAAFYAGYTMLPDDLPSWLPFAG